MAIYRVILTTPNNPAQYTAYEGTSKPQAINTQDAIRNTLILTGGTGLVVLYTGYLPPTQDNAVQVIECGNWQPGKMTFGV